jgi:hypothetical protein
MRPITNYSSRQCPISDNFMQAFNSLNHKILLERILFQTLLSTSFLNRTFTFTKLEHVVTWGTHEANKPRSFFLHLISEASFMSSMPGLEKSVESVSAFLVSPLVSFRFVKKSSDRQLQVQTVTFFSKSQMRNHREALTRLCKNSSQDHRCEHWSAFHHLFSHLFWFFLFCITVVSWKKSQTLS